jgi:hypothetical protein
MSNSNMVISWVNSDSSITTSQRSASGNNQPLTTLVKASPYTVNMPQTDLITVNNTKTLSVSWLFAQTTAPSDAVQYMYAYGPNAPSSSATDATIKKHSKTKQFTMDLTKPFNAATTPSTSDTDPSTTTVGGSSATSTSTSSSDDEGAVRDLSTNNSTRIIFVHVIFMSVAWLLLAPLAVLLARYGRMLFTWYPHHRNIQLGTILLTFIAFFLAVSFLSVTDSPHFVETHHIVGLVIVILVFVQASLGLFAHKFIAKTGRRIVGFVHIPLGLVIILMAIWNMETGINLWEWAPSPAFRYFIYGWMGFIVLLYLAGLAFIPKEIKYHKQRNIEKKGVHQLDSYDS